MAGEVGGAGGGSRRIWRRPVGRTLPWLPAALEQVVDELVKERALREPPRALHCPAARGATLAARPPVGAVRSGGDSPEAMGTAWSGAHLQKLRREVDSVN